MSEDRRAVVGYIRVSTKEQKESKLSIIHQEQKIRAWADSQDFKLAKIFNDEAESAKDLDRPAVQELLGLVDGGKVSRVIIYKLDRLTRSVRDLGNLLERFEKNNVALSSVYETLDTASAGGRLVVNVMASVAQWERETIAERTQAALDIKRQNSEKLGGICPYGYRARQGTLHPFEEEQKVLKGILKARGEGRGYQDIAEALNEQGVKPRKGAAWYAATIRFMCLREARRRAATAGSGGNPPEKTHRNIRTVERI